MEALLASLPVPIAVAVVTAAVTSWLSARRSAADRVAELRLKAYTDAVVAANTYMRLVGGIKTGERESGEVTEGFVDLYERLQVLSIVASSRTIERIDESLDKMDASGIAHDGMTLEQALDAAAKFEDEASDLVQLLINESRRDVRRTRA